MDATAILVLTGAVLGAVTVIHPWRLPAARAPKAR